jgi:outer membrane protein assembly factor BamB
LAHLLHVPRRLKHRATFATRHGTSRFKPFAAASHRKRFASAAGPGSHRRTRMTCPRLVPLLLALFLAGTAVAADSIVGTWTGEVTAPQGTTQLTLRFAEAGENRFDVTMHMPRMHTYGHAFAGAAEKKGDAYLFPGLSTEFRIEGDAIVGTFGLSKLPFKLTRGGEMSPRPEPPRHPDAPAPLWTRDLGSPTWAHPVVENGIVFVGTRDGRFHATRASDGAVRWTWPGTGARIDGRAVVAGDTVYFVDGQNAVVALAVADGSLRWRTVLHDAQFTDGKPPVENPTFNRRVAIPLVEGDTLYCGSSDGGLYALDAASGARRWRHDAKAPIFSGIARFDSNTIAFGTMDGSVVQFSTLNRKETGRFKTGGGVVTTPLLVGENVIAGSRDYMLYGFKRATGETAWKFSYWFSWVESTPQLRDGLVYVGASDYRRITAFDPANGRELWGTDVGGMCWGWPAVSEETVYIGTVAQNLDGTVIRHTGSFAAIERHTGRVKWQHLTPEPAPNSFGGIAGSPALAGDRVITAGFDGTLTAWPDR